MALLKAENISVQFNGRQILDNVSLHLNEGELVSIMGVSGSGKTTLFNVISGLMTPDSGEVFMDGQDITGQSGHMSYMLQKDLLLPHKTILDNVAMPLIFKGLSRKEARRQADSYFEEFGLKGTQQQYPFELSGGMRQRAALLRTYMFSDRIALLDEPFSALDTLTKSNMHKWYVNIMKQINLSTLFITHDIDEAILLSDRIYILGQSPATVTEEIQIEPSDVRNSGLMLSGNYLRYKKRIIDAIGEY
ncbi:MAG: ABC transporter ATP-binding protein [Butyrivibrio sp.]